jgi:adenine-specific DNA-methyltransferase
MPKFLLEALPEIVAKGKRRAEQILEGIVSPNRVSLQTRELVILSKTSSQINILSNKRRGGRTL